MDTSNFNNKNIFNFVQLVMSLMSGSSNLDEILKGTQQKYILDYFMANAKRFIFSSCYIINHKLTNVPPGIKYFFCQIGLYTFLLDLSYKYKNPELRSHYWSIILALFWVTTRNIENIFIAAYSLWVVGSGKKVDQNDLLDFRSIRNKLKMKYQELYGNSDIFEDDPLSDDDEDTQMRKNKNIFKNNGGNFSPIEIIRLIITVNKMWDKDFFVSSLPEVISHPILKDNMEIIKDNNYNNLDDKAQYILATILLMIGFSKLSDILSNDNQSEVNRLIDVMQKYAAQKYSLDQYFFKALKDPDIKKFDGNIAKFDIYADKYRKYVKKLNGNGIEVRNANHIEKELDIKKDYLNFCSIMERGEYDMDNLKNIKNKFKKYDCTGSTETCVLKQLVLDKSSDNFKPKECHPFVFKTYKENYQFGTKIQPLKIHTAFINNKWIQNIMKNSIGKVMSSLG